jgi:hypothetical protein
VIIRQEEISTGEFVREHFKQRTLFLARGGIMKSHWFRDLCWKFILSCNKKITRANDQYPVQVNSSNKNILQVMRRNTTGRGGIRRKRKLKKKQ